MLLLGFTQRVSDALQGNDLDSKLRPRYIGPFTVSSSGTRMAGPRIKTEVAIFIRLPWDGMARLNLFSGAPELTHRSQNQHTYACTASDDLPLGKLIDSVSGSWQ
jgi:hypothetical protein